MRHVRLNANKKMVKKGQHFQINLIKKCTGMEINSNCEKRKRPRREDRMEGKKNKKKGNTKDMENGRTVLSRDTTYTCHAVCE